MTAAMSAKAANQEIPMREGEMSLIVEDYRDDQQQEPESAMNPPDTFAQDQQYERKCYGEQQARQWIGCEGVRNMGEVRQLSVCPFRFFPSVNEGWRDLALAFRQQVEIGDGAAIEALIDGLSAPFVHVEDVGRPHPVARRHGVLLVSQILTARRRRDTRPTDTQHFCGKVAPARSAASLGDTVIAIGYDAAFDRPVPYRPLQPGLCKRAAWNGRRTLLPFAVRPPRVKCPLGEFASVDVDEANALRMLRIP
jgi:hypothetical protein